MRLRIAADTSWDPRISGTHWLEATAPRHFHSHQFHIVEPVPLTICTLYFHLAGSRDLSSSWLHRSCASWRLANKSRGGLLSSPVNGFGGARRDRGARLVQRQRKQLLLRHTRGHVHHHAYGNVNHQKPLALQNRNHNRHQVNGSILFAIAGRFGPCANGPA
jgi:hypothetical protein